MATTPRTVQSGRSGTAGGDQTRQRLLRTAESLIAERGLDSVSIRDITGAAEANSASIHYHFRSKEGLVKAILADRAEDMSDRRRRHLESLGPAPTPHEVASAMVAPTFELVETELEEGARSSAYVGFLASLLDDPSLVPLISEHFGDQYEHYLHALRRARPDLNEEAAVNLISFALHLVLNAVSEPARGLRVWIETHHPESVASIKNDLVEFLAAGFEATSPRMTGTEARP